MEDNKAGKVSVYAVIVGLVTKDKKKLLICMGISLVLAVIMTYLQYRVWESSRVLGLDLRVVAYELDTIPFSADPLAELNYCTGLLAQVRSGTMHGEHISSFDKFVRARSPALLDCIDKTHRRISDNVIRPDPLFKNPSVAIKKFGNDCYNRTLGGFIGISKLNQEHNSALLKENLEAFDHAISVLRSNPSTNSLEESYRRSCWVTVNILDSWSEFNSPEYAQTATNFLSNLYVLREELWNNVRQKTIGIPGHFPALAMSTERRVKFLSSMHQTRRQ